MKRTVTLIHYGGGAKPGLDGSLVKADKPQLSKVHVAWDLHGVLIFSATTGLEHGRPRGPWRLSDEDIAAFCEELKIKPIRRVLAELKGRKPKPVKVDPRQLALVSK